MKNKIYILSDGLHSGKTTLLQNWITGKSGISGILSPKINGKRHFKNIKTGEERLLEVVFSDLKIGKYYFDPAVFQWAVDALQKEFESDSEWIIIDETGPLEIKFHQGFHSTIQNFLSSNSQKNILFVVRDFLVQDFIEEYKIEYAEILPLNYFKKENPPVLNGIILAGGKSSRMQSDKALLLYEDQPQWKAAAQLLAPFVQETFISVHAGQTEKWSESENYSFVEDDVLFEGKGPISGILSVAEANGERGFLVLGIDYPLMKMENLIALNNGRSALYEAICFVKEGFLEPLCSIYEQSAIEKMKIYFRNGGESLNHFLKTIKTRTLIAENTVFLTNVNSKAEFLEMKNSKL